MCSYVSEKLSLSKYKTIVFALEVILQLRLSFKRTNVTTFSIHSETHWQYNALDVHNKDIDIICENCFAFRSSDFPLALYHSEILTECAGVWANLTV